MNKIYKVIWNEARNAYVVVSEIAKNHGSKSCSTKKLLAMLIATGVMTCASFDVLAAEPAAEKTAAQQYVALKAKEFDVKPSLISPDRPEWDAQQRREKKIGGYTYIYDETNKYWVREGYVLTVNKNGGKYTTLSENAIRADVAYKDGVAKGILQSVTSTVSASGTVTNMGDSLNKVTAGSFAGVSHAGGTEVAGSWDYIIKDDSWEGEVAPSNYNAGYVNLYAGENAPAPKGFVNTESPDLIWDDSRQAYFYKNQRVDYSNMYVINGKLGVFTNADSTKVYTGTVYGKNNEILMTVKDKDNKFYSYWAAEVTDPSATMATYRVEEYNKNLAKLVENDDALYRNDIKEVTLTKGENSATIGLMRNGDKAVDGAITVTSGGGTGGSGASHDTFVKISNAADTEGKTFATGSKVEAIVDNGATTGIKINGQDYTIKSGSKVSVAQNDKTTTITVDGKATTITDTDTHNALDSAKLDGKKLTITGQDKDSVEVDLSSIDTDVHIKSGEYKVNDKNKVSMNLVDKAGNDKGTVTITGVAKAEDVAVVYDANGSLKSTNAKSVGSSAIALGKEATAVANSIAIGDSSIAGYKGTVLGTNAESNREGATLVGYNTNSFGLYSTVVGTNATINTNGKTVYTKIVQGAAATVVGAMNKIDNTNGEGYSGVANNVMGAANTIEGSNGVTIQGSGNTVTDAYKDMDITYADGWAILGGDYSVLAKKESGAIAVVGGANTVSKQTDSTVIGYDNQLIGDEENISHDDVFMAGSHNRLNNVSDSIVMGNDNKISDRSNVISFGHKNAITANNAVAIGNGAGVSVEGGVALGVGSVASTDAGAPGYGAAEGETGIAWKATNGAVSVGSSVEGKKITRQITNVAAGTEDTDAVNVAQLKKVSEAAASASQGWKLKTQNGNASDVKPGATVEFDGDANIQVGNDGNKVSVTLKNHLTDITSVANGDSKINLNKDSIIISNGNKYFEITNSGIGMSYIGADYSAKSIMLGENGTTISGGLNVAGSKITGVAAGTADEDAVNVSQLRDVASIANKGWNLTTAHGKTTTVKPGDTVDFSPEDTNLTVTNEGTNVKIGLNQDLHLTSATFGNTTTINANGLTIGHGTAGLEFSQNRVSVGGQQIHDVADGKDDTDAVNVRQLKKAADSAKTTVVAGKNIKVDADTKKDGHTEYNVSLDDDITLGDKASNEFVTVSGTKGTIWAGHSVSAGTVIMDGDSGTITGLTNTTWNGTTDNLSRAATEGQLKQVADAATSNDKRLVQNPNDSDGSYQVKENGDVTLRVEDSNKNGYNVTIKDVASKAELDKVKTDVGNVDGFHDEIKNKDTNGKPTHTSVVDAVNNLDTKVNTIQSDVTKATEEAKKHSSVSTGNGLDLDVTDNNGQKDYKVSLKDDFTLGGKDGHTGSIEFKGSEGNITASGTLTANAVSVGNTSISDTGLQIGNKTSLTEDALTIGGNTYITDKGIDANQQKISNVADGDISKDSKDAVNGSQLYATNEAIANNYNNITNLNGRISNLDNRVNKVGAGAAALAALHPLDFDPDAKWDFAAGYGNYRGANAAAVGAYYRPNEDTMFSVGGTFGNGENMVNAGVSFKLGSGSSHVSTSRVAMAKEIKELRGELEAMKSAMLDANAGKKIDTSKLQLFPDVPQNHWAYEYVAQLAGNGMIEGYPDGNFAGDRPMTRYEFAAILYRAMTKGAVLSDKILSEFSHELEYFTVDTIAKDKAGNPTIQRVRTVKENKNK